MNNKELFTDSEGIEYVSQITFPCAICTEIIPDWRIKNSADLIGSIEIIDFATHQYF